MHYVLGYHRDTDLGHLVVGDLVHKAIAHTLCGQDIPLEFARSTIVVCDTCLGLIEPGRNYVSTQDAQLQTSGEARNDD